MMLKPIWDSAKKFLAISQETQRSREEIKELRQAFSKLEDQVNELTRAVLQLRSDMERLRDNEAHERRNEAKEREILTLRLQLILSDFEKRLPPASGGKNTPPLIEE